MLYFTCSSLDLAREGVSRAKNLGIWEMCYKYIFGHTRIA